MELLDASTLMQHHQKIVLHRVNSYVYIIIAWLISPFASSGNCVAASIKPVVPMLLPYHTVAGTFPAVYLPAILIMG